MLRKIDYKREKKGWVLIDGETGAYFRDIKIDGGFRTTDSLDKAFMFKTRSCALNFVRRDTCLSHEIWLVARATVTHFVEGEKGVLVMPKKRSA